MLSATSNDDSVLAEVNRAIIFFDSINLPSYKHYAQTLQGTIFCNKGDYINAIRVFTQLLKAYKGNTKNEARILNRMGATYRQRGDYPVALDYYFKALKLYSRLNSEIDKADVCNNIGIVYLYQKDYEKALKYYKVALETYNTHEYNEGRGTAYLNIGEVYAKMGELDTAKDYYIKALVFAKSENDMEGIGTIYNEIAYINIVQNNLHEATYYLRQANDIFTRLNNSIRIAECNINYGDLYMRTNDYQKAQQHYQKALDIANKTQILPILSTANKKLSDIHEKLNNPTEALLLYKNHIKIRDSLYNKENTRKLFEAELLYQFERQQHEAKLEQEKNEAIYIEKSDKQRMIRNLMLVIVGMLLTIILGTIIVLRKYMDKNKHLKQHREDILRKNEALQQSQEEILMQRNEIERKNEVLEQSQRIIAEKNIRMISSIEYAQTIQNALLPNETALSDCFSDSFVIFKPKDIVSGDFYWIYSQNGIIDLVVMDCTGHGVSGAFMSLIGNTLLNQIVKEWQIHNPALVIERLDEMLRNLLHQNEGKTQILSSIDIAFLSINTTSMEATFAGAGRPILRIVDGVFEKIQGTSRSAGGVRPHNDLYFKNQTLNLTKGSCYYLTTDGYYDQMNYEMRKFGQRKFHKLLQSMWDVPMSMQREILINTITNYSNGEEQIDDICIVGFRV